MFTFLNHSKTFVNSIKLNSPACLHLKYKHAIKDLFFFNLKITHSLEYTKNELS